MRATPETYLGFARSTNIANSGGEDQTGPTVYKAPADVPLDDFALYGQWLAAPEYVHHAVAASPPGDSVGLHYRAKSVYVVAGSDGRAWSRGRPPETWRASRTGLPSLHCFRPRTLRLAN